MPRVNGQVERIHKIVIPMLSKLCQNNQANWYCHVDKIQQIINDTPPRTTKYSAYKILTGLNMRKKDDDIRKLFDDIEIDELNYERDEIRRTAQENIEKVQQEIRKTFNEKRKIETDYNLRDLVGIKLTQYGVGMKLRPTFFGPYKMAKKMKHGRYQVQKVGNHEGPNLTTTIAEFMKKWSLFTGE